MSGFLLEVSDLAGRPGATKSIGLTGTIEGLQGPVGGVDERDPVTVEAVAESLSDGIEVAGTVSGVLKLNCSRCLTDFEIPLDLSFNEVFYFRSAEDKGGYDGSGPMIDLEPMLRDVIGLEIPVAPLHDAACKGLCTVCGTDLNVEDCGHSQEIVDLRWVGLKEALEAQGIEKEE